MQFIISDAKSKMTKALEHFEAELAGVRSGRAQASLLDSVKVESYGQQMMIKQLATIGTPDARTIVIQAWDQSTAPAIEKAIRETQSLGLNPAAEGNIIRINIPPLTEDRRKELIKLLSGKVEEANISLRNARHEALNAAKKDASLTPDHVANLTNQLDKLVEENRVKAQSLFAAKEKELLEV